MLANRRGPDTTANPINWQIGQPIDPLVQELAISKISRHWLDRMWAGLMRPQNERDKSAGR